MTTDPAPPTDPPWLLALVKAAELAADEAECNGDHEGNDGCEGCAWAERVDAIPARLRNAADGWAREVANPMQYGFDDQGRYFSPDPEKGRVSGPGQRFNRCPTCERWEVLDAAWLSVVSKYTYAPGPGGNVERIAYLGATDMAPALAEWIRQQYRSLDRAIGRPS